MLQGVPDQARCKAPPPHVWTGKDTGDSTHGYSEGSHLRRMGQQETDVTSCSSVQVNDETEVLLRTSFRSKQPSAPEVPN